jgi:hypothetical protein
VHKNTWNVLRQRDLAYLSFFFEGVKFEGGKKIESVNILCFSFNYYLICHLCALMNVSRDLFNLRTGRFHSFVVGRCSSAISAWLRIWWVFIPLLRRISNCVAQANIFGTEQDRVNCSFYYKVRFLLRYIRCLSDPCHTDRCLPSRRPLLKEAHKTAVLANNPPSQCIS